MGVDRVRQNYSSKSICVIDFGLFVELAIKLTKWFGKVYYYYPWQSTAFPRSNSKLVGRGLPGIEVVEFFWDIVPDVDVFVFTEALLGDLQEELVRQGKLVFGSRRGEELELFRAESKEYFKKLGLPVGKYEVVKGMDALRKYLKANKNQFVKVSKDRGDFETFESPEYKYAEPKLNELEHLLGMKRIDKEFVVEEAIIDAVETGYDGFCIDGKYSSIALCGIEVKNKGYIMKSLPYKDLPVEITGFNNKIEDALRQYKYRGFVSTEIRVTRDRTPYMIDFCARCGTPPTEITIEMVENLPDVIWYGAKGEVVDIETSYKWGAEILISSGWADKNWQNVQFPASLRDKIKLRNLTVINNEYYIVPQAVGIPEIGAVVAVGETMEEVIEEAKELCNQVKGYFLESHMSCLDDAVAEIEKLRSFGVSF
jgi:hypothetical protein